MCKKASSLLSSGGSCEVLEIGKVRPLVTFLLFLLSALPVTAAESKTPQLQHPNRASHQLSNADLTHGENQVDLHHLVVPRQADKSCLLKKIENSVGVKSPSDPCGLTSL